MLGKSIDLLSVIASQHTVEGQQESNTVVGKRVIKEAVAFSLLEKKTKNYIALLISGKASEAVMATVWIPKEGGGDHSRRCSKPLPLTTARNSLTLPNAKAGVARCPLIRILRGNRRRTNATTDYSPPSSPQVLL